MDLLRELDGLSLRTWFRNGRLYVHRPNHPYANLRGFISNARAVIEDTISKNLSERMIPHHVDGDPSNDKNNNLVACEDLAYHNLIHARERALEACGNVHWRPCCVCHKYDDLKNLDKDRSHYYHKPCKNAYNRRIYENT